jgi:hypothetical protein
LADLVVMGTYLQEVDDEVDEKEKIDDDLEERVAASCAEVYLSECQGEVERQCCAKKIS